MITLTRRPLSVSQHALHVLSSCILCLAPPAVDLLEALDRCVCTRRACCFLFAYIAALLLLPLSFVLGVGAPSLSLVGFMIKAVRRGSLSFSWFVVASVACVYETGLLLVCACRTSAASVEPLPRGSRAVTVPRWLQVLSCSTWLIVRCCINSSSCVLASLAPILFHPPSCALWLLRRCLCCRGRLYSCCATLTMSTIYLPLCIIPLGCHF